jgi:hypothetical protein
MCVCCDACNTNSAGSRTPKQWSAECENGNAEKKTIPGGVSNSIWISSPRTRRLNHAGQRPPACNVLGFRFSLLRGAWPRAVEDRRCKTGGWGDSHAHERPAHTTVRIAHRACTQHRSHQPTSRTRCGSAIAVSRSAVHASSQLWLGSVCSTFLVCAPPGRECASGRFQSVVSTVDTRSRILISLGVPLMPALPKSAA